jgi:transposase InsO family protein
VSGPQAARFRPFIARNAVITACAFPADTNLSEETRWNRSSHCRSPASSASPFHSLHMRRINFTWAGDAMPGRKPNVGRLEAHRILASMSRAGNPYDNAKAESFMKTLKKEEVRVQTYRTLADARASIGHFLETTYNTKRLHSSLGYQPPVEFEANFRQTNPN